MNTLEEVLEAMAAYTRDNPTHGWNSAGKDPFLREGRAILRDHPEWLTELLYLADVLRRSP